LDRPYGPAVEEIELFFGVAERKGISLLAAKGYGYSTGTPSPVLDSLDNLSRRAVTPAYRRIKDNWYLYYDASNY